MAPIIEAHGLAKRSGKTTALDGLDLVARSGRVVVLLGPDGAGKTTFVRAVATLLRPDGGSLRVAGIDALRHPRRVRRAIGLAGQSAAVEEAVSGRENLESARSTPHLAEVLRLADAAGLLRDPELATSGMRDVLVAAGVG